MDVLHRLGTVSTLGEFCRVAAPASGAHPAWAAFLNAHVVAWPPSAPAPPTPEANANHTDQQQLIEYAVSELFSRTSAPTHMLALGFRRDGPDLGRSQQLARSVSVPTGAPGGRQPVVTAASTMHGIVTTYPNPFWIEMAQAPWSQLLSVVGDHFMLRLLVHAIVCRPLPNGCLEQISGPCVMALAKPAAPVKHLKLEAAAAPVPPSAVKTEPLATAAAASVGSGAGVGPGLLPARPARLFLATAFNRFSIPRHHMLYGTLRPVRTRRPALAARADGGIRDPHGWSFVGLPTKRTPHRFPLALSLFPCFDLRTRVAILVAACADSCVCA